MLAGDDDKRLLRAPGRSGKRSMAACFDAQSSHRYFDNFIDQVRHGRKAGDTVPVGGL
jgi:hypothetical protein